jgi:glycyl-tRNA synthetase (class II)
VAARGDFDLQQHSGSSGKSMEYFDEATKRKYVLMTMRETLESHFTL